MQTVLTELISTKAGSCSSRWPPSSRPGVLPDGKRRTRLTEETVAPTGGTVAPRLGAALNVRLQERALPERTDGIVRKAYVSAPSRGVQPLPPPVKKRYLRFKTPRRDIISPTSEYEGPPAYESDTRGPDIHCETTCEQQPLGNDEGSETEEEDHLRGRAPEIHCKNPCESDARGPEIHCETTCEHQPLGNDEGSETGEENHLRGRASRSTSSQSSSGAHWTSSRSLSSGHGSSRSSSCRSGQAIIADGHMGFNNSPNHSQSDLGRRRSNADHIWLIPRSPSPSCSESSMSRPRQNGWQILKNLLRRDPSFVDDLAKFALNRSCAEVSTSRSSSISVSEYSNFWEALKNIFTSPPDGKQYMSDSALQRFAADVAPAKSPPSSDSESSTSRPHRNGWDMLKNILGSNPSLIHDIAELVRQHSTSREEPSNTVSPPCASPSRSSSRRSSRKMNKISKRIPRRKMPPEHCTSDLRRRRSNAEVMSSRPPSPPARVSSRSRSPLNSRQFIRKSTSVLSSKPSLKCYFNAQPGRHCRVASTPVGRPSQDHPGSTDPVHGCESSPGIADPTHGSQSSPAPERTKLEIIEEQLRAVRQKLSNQEAGALSERACLYAVDRAKDSSHVNRMLRKLGDQFVTRGHMAETWIQQPCMWPYETAQHILEKLGKPTKPDQQRYFTACLYFKSFVDNFMAEACVTSTGRPYRFLPSSPMEDTESTMANSSPSKETKSPPPAAPNSLAASSSLAARVKAARSRISMFQLMSDGRQDDEQDDDQQSVDADKALCSEMSNAHNESPSPPRLSVPAITRASSAGQCSSTISRPSSAPSSAGSVRASGRDTVCRKVTIVPRLTGVELVKTEMELVSKKRTKSNPSPLDCSKDAAAKLCFHHHRPHQEMNDLEIVKLRVVSWTSQADRHPATNLCRGKDGSLWQSVGPPKQAMVFDVGRAREIRGMVLRCLGTQADPQDVTFSRSSAKNGPWSIVSRIFVLAGVRNRGHTTHEFFFDPGGASRYWRLAINHTWGGTAHVCIVAPLSLLEERVVIEEERVVIEEEYEYLSHKKCHGPLELFFSEDLTLSAEDREVRKMARQHNIPLYYAESVRDDFRKYACTTKLLDYEGFSKLLRAMVTRSVSGSSSMDLNVDIPENRIRHMWKEVGQDINGYMSFENYLIWFHQVFYCTTLGTVSQHSPRAANTVTERFYAGLGRERLMRHAQRRAQSAFDIEAGDRASNEMRTARLLAKIIKARQLTVSSLSS